MKTSKAQAHRIEFAFPEGDSNTQVRVKLKPPKILVEKIFGFAP
jgi:hypothetical protein